MRVITKLARLEFAVGAIRRDGDELVIESHPDQAMKAQARVGIEDIAAILKASTNRDVLGYLVSLPLLAVRRRRERRQAGTTGSGPTKTIRSGGSQ